MPGVLTVGMVIVGVLILVLIEGPVMLGVLMLASGVLMLTSGVLIFGVEMVPLAEELISTPLFPIIPVANKMPNIKLRRASKPKSPQQTGPHQLPLAFY